MPDPILARRTYRGKTGAVEATLGMPTSFGDGPGSSWFVTVSITGPDHRVRQDIGGADAVQAISLACQVLETLAQSEGLRWPVD